MYDINKVKLALPGLLKLLYLFGIFIQSVQELSLRNKTLPSSQKFQKVSKFYW